MPDAGNILMFLPGTHEIRKTIELLEKGSLCRAAGMCFHSTARCRPPRRRRRSARGPKPKIIVATNVAETSLTIDGCAR
jgi:ATP-dependent helicase HrpB